MSLTKAVKFRFLADQLSQPETIHFVNKLLTDNTSIILSALFHQILNTADDGDTINEIISNIILSRPKKPKPKPILINIPDPTQNVKLDELPKRLIGVISSFLKQSDNIQFAKTKRFIYLGCNSPNLLQELELIGLRDCTSINLRLFPSIKHLGVSLSQCNQIFLPPMTAMHMTGLPVMNELESIALYGDNCDEVKLDDALSSPYINTQNVTKLTCTHNANIIRILPKFPNVQYLHIHNTVFYDVNSIKYFYPNLKGLAVNLESPVNRDLIRAFGNNLDFLSFSGDLNFDYNFKNINFGKLEELRVMSVNSKSIYDILQTAKSLKKIFIFPKPTKGTMSKLIKSCKSLEYIEFVDDYAFVGGAAVDEIKDGLFETKNWKRNKIKIRASVIMNWNEILNQSLDALNTAIGKLVVFLDTSKINDFMFILAVRGLIKKTDKNIILQALKSECSSTNISVDMFESYFVIKNNDCRINGFCESWKFE